MFARSEAKQPLVAHDKTTFFGHYFHGAHAPVAAAPVMACMHAYNIGQALIVLSTAMI
jgi:hypothetical protein